MMNIIKPGAFICPGCGQEVKGLHHNPIRCPEKIEHHDAYGIVTGYSTCNYYYEQEVKEHIFPAKVGNFAANVGIKFFVAVIGVFAFCFLMIPAMINGIKGSEGAQGCGIGFLLIIFLFGFVFSVIGGVFNTTKKVGGGFWDGLKNLFK